MFTEQIPGGHLREGFSSMNIFQQVRGNSDFTQERVQFLHVKGKSALQCTAIISFACQIPEDNLHLPPVFPGVKEIVMNIKIT